MQGVSEIVGYFNSRIVKSNNSNENIGEYEEVKNNKNGAKMLKFLKNNEMMTLNDRIKKLEPEWTRKCIQKGESSILDFIEHRSNKETEIPVCAADVGSTDHCQTWTDSQQTTVIKSRCGRK